MALGLYQVNTSTYKGVEEWMWECAANRKGDYEVQNFLTYDHIGYGTKTVMRPVRLTRDEMKRLDCVVSNQLHVCPKPTVMGPIIYQTARQIWPDGDPASTAMRTLGPWALLSYRAAADGNGRDWERKVRMVIGILLGFAAAIDGYFFVRHPWYIVLLVTAAVFCWFCFLIRYFMPTQSPRLVLLGKNMRVPTSETDPPKRNKLGYLEPGEGDKDVHPLGSTHGDGDIRAIRQDRVIVKEAGVGIIGQSTSDETAKQIVGVVALPIAQPPNVYAKEAKNIEIAIDERYNKKKIPFAGTPADKRRLGKMVGELIGNHPLRACYSAKRIADWFSEHVFLDGDLKSGKWTQQRFQNTLEGLCKRVDPTFRLKTDVKLEAMPEGKPPRFLIADGDEGQVLALLTICCIEDLTKKFYPQRGIKGLAKVPALERAMSSLRVPNKRARKGGKSVFEGDGSAWDTTCNAEVRDLVENVIIKHVANALKTYMDVPDCFVDAHVNACINAKLKLEFSKNKEFFSVVIDAIRRSGHRGTSILNWITNFVLWHCAIFADPELFCNNNCRNGTDVLGEDRWLASAFEGDDSALSTSPKIERKSPLEVSILQFWQRMGFNMKIFQRDTVMEFTGWRVAVDDHGPTETMMPDIARCMGRAGVSCSAWMLEQFKLNNVYGCNSVRKAAALARAYEYAGILPEVSKKYLQFAKEINAKAHIDRDFEMRVDSQVDETNLEATIQVLNAEMSIDAQLERLRKCGFDTTEEEYFEFTFRNWTVEQLGDWEGFDSSLPKSWKSSAIPEE